MGVVELAMMVDFTSELGGNGFWDLFECNASAGEPVGANADFSIRSFTNNLFKCQCVV
jgi:hypothetical protein